MEIILGFLGFLMCLALGLINLPYVLQGNIINLCSMIFSFCGGVFLLIFGIVMYIKNKI